MADVDKVRVDIEVNAKGAIQQLRDMSRSAASAEEAVAKFSSFLVTNSKKWQIPIQQLREEFRMLNAELAGQKKQTLFGNFGNQKIFDMERVFTDSAQAAGRFQVAEDGVVTSINRGNKAYDAADRAARGYGHSIDVVRTALGTLVAVGIFQFLNLITEGFQQAVKASRELEDSMFRLGNVEKILSQEGTNVSLEGLKKGITDIKKLFPIFSKEDVTQLVAQIAISTKDLGFTEKQILNVAKAVGVLNIRSTEEETATQTAQKVISSLITDNAKGIAGLGLSFREAEIEATAMSMGLLKAGESAQDLTTEEKAQVKYHILLQNTNGELANMSDYMDTNTAKIKENSASWHDLLTSIGSIFTSLTPLLSPVVNVLIEIVNNIKALIVTSTVAANAVKMLWAAFTTGTPQERIENVKKLVAELPSFFDKVGADLVKRLFPDRADIPDWLKNIFGQGVLTEIDTPTKDVPANIAKDAEDAAHQAEAFAKVEDKITDIFAEARDKRADIDEAYRRKIEDANRDHAQRLEDIARDTERKLDDAQRNYNQKVEDINRDADQKLAEAKQDQRNKDLEREKEYQNKLRELQERFLFDLEDALRERDARQVLRLIREYNFDKKNLEEKRKLEKQQAKKELADKLADIERERQIKLEAARRELAEKQAEIALWAERERQDAAIALQRKLDDARTWHQRELQEYQEYLKRKLQALAAEIVKEYQLTAAGAQAIYQLLNSYFGSNGSIQSLLGNALTANLQGIVSTSSSSGSSVPSGFQGSGLYGTYAEGGTIIANRPTRAVFGERGPEAVTITPLNRVGADVGKVFGDTSNMGGVGGNVSISLELSPDLEARIVDSSLESVSVHLEKIARSK